MSTQEASSPKTAASGADVLRDYAPVPPSSVGPALNDQGYYVGRVERNLYWDNDPTRPVPEDTFADRRTLKIGGERIELAWRGPNHSPDNIYIHFPDHDALMLIDIVNPGWAPISMSNLSEDIPGYVAAPAIAL